MFKWIYNFFNESKVEETNVKIDFKKKLDEISKSIHPILKEKGFKKRGRTFNKDLENGLIQVVNFQMSKFYNHYEREFTVNLGVFIKEIYDLQYDKKTFIQEYDCRYRNRLGNIDNETDVWWNLNIKDSYNIKNEIKELIKDKGFNWFEKLSSRDKIIKSLEKENKSYKSKINQTSFFEKKPQKEQKVK